MKDLKPEFRITKVTEGRYCVEYLCQKWWGRLYWKPFITYSGAKEVFYFSTYDNAEKNLMEEIKFRLKLKTK